MPDHQDIGVFNAVLFSFQAEKSLFADTRVAAMVHQVLPVNHFGADELLLQIGMNGSAGTRCGAMNWNGPGAHFRFSGSEERHETQHLVGSGDQTLESGLLESIAGEILGGLFRGAFADLSLNFSADGRDSGT